MSVGNVAQTCQQAKFFKIFLFFLTVLFYCDVGERGLELNSTPWGLYESLNFKSENEALYGKLLCY